MHFVLRLRDADIRGPPGVTQSKKYLLIALEQLCQVCCLLVGSGELEY
jgi:hypothetical protein